MNNPIVAELFSLARMTTEVAEHLAHGTGRVGVSLESQVNPLRDNARAFWGKWK